MTKSAKEVRDFAAKQNSDSYLASENLRAETSAAEAEEAEKGEKLHLQKGEALHLRR